MITLEEIKKFYTSDLHKFDRGLLREYLQYLILAIIFSHKLSIKLSFLGGTCLRIVYGTKRFSEDIDFDNKNLSIEEFNILAEYIKKELEKSGLEVEINTVHKMAFHCNIKFPNVLLTNKLTKIEEEKILIQVDTFDKGVNYSTETFILNKFDITKPIIITPKSVILSQKLWTITNRKRAKGRDFYDIIYLLQNTKPDKEFLYAKFETNNLAEIKQKILDHLDLLDFEDIAKDVKPFLMDENDLDKITYFKEIFAQTTLS